MKRGSLPFALLAFIPIVIFASETTGPKGGVRIAPQSQLTKSAEDELFPSWDDKGNLTFCIAGTEASRGSVDLGGDTYFAYLDPARAPRGRALDREFKDERDYERGPWVRWALTSGDRVDVVERWGQMIHFSTAYDSSGLPGRMRSTIDTQIVVTQGPNKFQIAATRVTRYACPSISPDGAFVVYSAGPGDARVRDIWRVDIRAGAPGSPICLTKGIGWNFLPVVGPDGKAIYFVSHRGGQSEIWTMDRDGSSQTRLTTGADVFLGLDVAASGSRITYSSRKGVAGRAGSDSGNIWIMNVDGSRPVQLTLDGKSQWPVFSRDGRRIAYLSHGAGNWDVWVLDIGEPQ
jgi:Tol biopolymer transport system component